MASLLPADLPSIRGARLPETYVAAQEASTPVRQYPRSRGVLSR